MKKTIKLLTMTIFLTMCLFQFACKKEDTFLAAVPNIQLAIPKSLNDLQLLLQYEEVFNAHEAGYSIVAGERFSTTDALFSGFNKVNQNAYTWASVIYPVNADIGEWRSPYTQVLYANTVLDYLPKVADGQSQTALYNQVKGTALFFRAKAYFSLMQLFTMPYKPSTANSDLGVPLRLTSDLNAKVDRATQQQCYDQILSDLQESTQLLPSKTSNICQPTDIAAYGLLARINLSLGRFSDAFNNSNIFLNKFNALTDYNTLTPGGQISTTYLSEDVFHMAAFAYYIVMSTSRKVVDPTLYASYANNDLRKSICYSVSAGRTYFSGTYDINLRQLYTGIATDELYLIRAECYARAGNANAAMADLNTLLATRWKTGTFVPYTASSADDALQQILNERDKELVCRGLRWYDLRRLNIDPKFAKTLTRTNLGVTYTLPPNDLRYAMLIPDQEIALTGIPQNAR